MRGMRRLMFTALFVGMAHGGEPPPPAEAYGRLPAIGSAAYLTLPANVEAKNLPLVLLVHGGPHARDDFTFSWWSSFLASRGYAVLQANYRGSTGYGYDWFNAGRGGWGSQAAKVRAPILLIHGTEDTVVPVEQSRRMNATLRAAGKQVTYVELKGDDHWLSSASMRTQMLQEVEKFLTANLGSAPGGTGTAK
jgi:dipeptidyl aminopeptidase/acylaminoacyl peptidase